MGTGGGDWLEEEPFEVPPAAMTAAAPAGRPGRGPRRRNWIVLAVCLMVAAGVVVVLVRGAAGPLASDQSIADSSSSAVRSSSRPGGTSSKPITSSNPTVATSTRRSRSSTSSTSSAPVRVTDVGHPLLDTSSDWTLFTYDQEGRLTKVEPAKGLVTVSDTDGSAVLTRGIRNFGSDGLISVPGTTFVGSSATNGQGRYLFEDGKPGRPVEGLLASAGQVFPGPHPGQWWVADPSRMPSPAFPLREAVLVGSDGRELGLRRAVPQAEVGQWSGDGSGGLLYSTAGGVYRVDAEGARRLSSGSLLAVSNGRFLTVECDRTLRCGAELVEVGSGRRRPLPELPTGIWQGELSPDGQMVLVTTLRDRGSPEYYLVDLRTGDSRLMDDTHTMWGAQVAFSPDHRYLFAIGSDGRLQAIDTTDGRSVAWGIDIWSIGAVAVRDQVSQ